MSDSFSLKHRAREIRYISAEKRLEVDFEDGASFSYPAEYLRVESPSAEVQGHGPGQKQVVAGRRHVGILHELGREQTEIWAAYLAALDHQGLSREPPGRA
jgi:DUF971 family protein